MKPYPCRNQSRAQRIYNYRLSRARRVVENAFGILANRWRVFLTHINLAPETVEQLVLAACALHNYLRTECPSYSCNIVDREDDKKEIIPGAWHQDPILAQAALPVSRNPCVRAKEQRDYLCQYVNSTVELSLGNGKKYIKLMKFSLFLHLPPVCLSARPQIPWWTHLGASLLNVP